MTGQQLKNSILQEAIQGRLVLNVLENGEKTGTELLECYQKENEARGKKAKKVTLPTIEEGPWGLPEEWCWCLLPNVATIEYGFPFDSTKFNTSGQGTPLVRIRDVVPGYTKTYTTESASKEYLVHKGDMLTGMDGNFNVSFWDSDDAYLNQRVCRITANKQIIEQRYLYYYLPAAFKEIEEGVSFVTVKHLSDKHLRALAIPLPPLSIQRKIVEILDEVVPQIEAFDKAARELEELNTALPEKLRKSVLQEAIHGNLVSNDIPEGEANASELLQQILKERQEKENKDKGKKAKTLSLSEIDEDLDELPDGWCWCKLSDIGDCLYGVSESAKVTGTYKLLRITDIQNDSVNWDTVPLSDYKKKDVAKYYLIDGDLVFARTGGTVGKSYLIQDAPKNAIYASYLIRVRFQGKALLPKYIKFFFQSPQYWNQIIESSEGTGQPNCNGTKLANLNIPLPPLSIQHRIVEKIEEVFATIDKLQA